MEILGIGMSELVFIIIIALIVLGPKDMQKAGKTIGRFLRNVVTSDGWRAFQQTSREIRSLPTRLMREANDELNKIGDEINTADPTHSRYGKISVPSRPPTNPPKPSSSPIAPVEEKSAKPPASKSEPPADDQEKNA
jgi:Sec-independent protein translocase protein TatA